MLDWAVLCCAVQAVLAVLCAVQRGVRDCFTTPCPVAVAVLCHSSFIAAAGAACGCYAGLPPAGVLGAPPSAPPGVHGLPQEAGVLRDIACSFAGTARVQFGLVFGNSWCQTKKGCAPPCLAVQMLLIVRPVVTQEEAYETEQKKLVPGM